MCRCRRRRRRARPGPDYASPASKAASRREPPFAPWPTLTWSKRAPVFSPIQAPAQPVGGKAKLAKPLERQVQGRAIGDEHFVVVGVAMVNPAVREVRDLQTEARFVVELIGGGDAQTKLERAAPSRA